MLWVNAAACGLHACTDQQCPVAQAETRGGHVCKKVAWSSMRVLGGVRAWGQYGECSLPHKL